MAEVKVLHPHEFEKEVSSGAMTRLAAVSGHNAGAHGIYMALVTVPPGCAATPHRHTNCETAIFIISGHGQMLTGPDLDRPLPFGPGDCIYVPPGAVHQPVNNSLSEPVQMVLARNSPVEVVEEYLPSKARAAGH